MRLFYKFLLALLISSVLPLILYSIIMLITTGTTLKKVIDKNNVYIVSNLSREIDNFFSEVNLHLSFVSRFERPLPLSSIQKSKLLMSAMEKSDLFVYISLLDRYGNSQISMSNVGPIESTQIDKILFKKAEQSGWVELGNVYYNSGKPYMDIIYPLETNPREYIYLTVKLQPIWDRINRYITEHDKIISILLIDSSGKIVSEPSGGTINLREIENYLTTANNKVSIKKNVVTTAAFAKGPKWTILLQAPANKVYAAVRRMQVNAIILILFTCCMVFGAAFTLARHLSKPIEVLTSGIEALAAGNIDFQLQRIPKASNDEMMKLTIIFNSMVGKLKKLQEELIAKTRLSTIGQMMNIVAHEIRNPLTAITNAVYFIKLQISKMTDVNPKVLQHISIIEEEVSATNKIIEDMLNFSRTRPLVIVERDINELIKETLQEIKLLEKIKTELILSPLPLVPIDTNEIKQVIRNLINNAIAAMEPKGGVLTLRTSTTYIPVSGENIPAVKIDVSDTGCGIPPENIEKIFEPFFSTRPGGTGLGLPVVKKIVEERHKGVIKINSKVGEGTTFSVILPISRR